MQDNFEVNHTLELRRHTLKVGWHLGTQKIDGDRYYYFKCWYLDPYGVKWIELKDGTYMTQLPEDTSPKLLLEASMRVLDILETSGDEYDDKRSVRWKDALELFSWISPELLEQSNIEVEE